MAQTFATPPASQVGYASGAGWGPQVMQPPHGATALKYHSVTGTH